MRLLTLLILLAASLYGQTTPTVADWTNTSPSKPAGMAIQGYDGAVRNSVQQISCAPVSYKTAGWSEMQTALGCYDYAKNRFIVGWSNGPFHSAYYPQSGHPNSSQAYISDQNMMCGYWGDGSGGLEFDERNLGHLWCFDFGAMSGRDLQIKNPAWLEVVTPQAASCYNPTTHKMSMYPAPNYTDKMLEIDTTNWAISFPATTGSHPNVGNFSFRYRPVDGKCYLYGGGQDGVYTYADATHTWAKLTTTCTGTCTGDSGTAPPARTAAGFAYSVDADKFLMVAGAPPSNPAGTAFTDTWVLDPAASPQTWTQQSPAHAFPDTSGSAMFDRLVYNETAHVFEALTAGSVQVYPLAGSSPGAFGPNSAFPATAGSLNRITPSGDTQGWAMDVAFARNGTGTIYEAHVESGTPTDTTECGKFHPYLQSTTNAGSSWNKLPSGLTTAQACAAIDPEVSQATNGADVHVAEVGGVIWEAHQKWYGNITYPRAYARFISGGTYSGGVVPCFAGTCPNQNETQRPLALGASGTTPVMLLEEYQSYFGGNAYLYLAKYNGTAWVSVTGGTQLNINAFNSTTRVLSAAMDSDASGNVAVVFSEEQHNPTSGLVILQTPRIFAKLCTLAGTCTQFTSAALNTTGSAPGTIYAYDPSVKVLNSKYYFTWAQRTQGGPKQIFMAVCTSTSSCAAPTGPLNYYPSGWAEKPTLDTDGTYLYLGFAEQSALGQKFRGRVKRYNGTTWDYVSSTLAADPVNGTVENFQVLASNSSVYAGWAELTYGALKQSYFSAVTFTPLNTITITNTGSTESNHPVQIGRPFVLGELASGLLPQAFVDGVAVTTQVDVKARWPDSSLKHAVISFMVPTFTSGQTYTVSFAPGTVAGNTALTQAQMLDSSYNFDAQIKVTKTGVTKSGVARTMLTNGDYTVWASGPVATTIILGNHANSTTCGGNAASTYDFGFDSFCPFRPLFEATFWPTTHQVWVRYVGELANTEQIEDLAVDQLDLTIGNTSPSTWYTNTSLTKFTGLSRWTKTRWLGGTPAVDGINHNISYLSATTFLANYDPQWVPASGTLTTIYNNWIAAPHDLYQPGLLERDMLAGGGRAGDEIGPYPQPIIQWLYTGSAKMQEISALMTDLAGAWQIYFREGNSAKKIDRGNTTSGLGHVMAVSNRPSLQIDQQVSLVNGQNFNLATDPLRVVGSLTQSTYSGTAWNKDIAHQAGWTPMYWVTGDYFYLEYNWFLAGWTTDSGKGSLAGNYELGRGPTGAEGHMSSYVSNPYQIRGQGWGFRNRVETAFSSPDGTPEKAYFTQLIADTIASWEGERNILGSAYQGNTMWTWANQWATSTFSTCQYIWCVDTIAGVNTGVPTAIHFWVGGSAGFNNTPESTAYQAAGASIPGWETNIVIWALGRARELGYATNSLVSWVAPYLISQTTDAGYNPWLSAAYRVPTKDTSTGAYFTAWSQIKAQMCTNTATGCTVNSSAQTATTFDAPVNVYGPGCATDPTGDGICGIVYYYSMALSMLQDQSNFTSAWSFVNTNITSNSVLNDYPRYAIIPRVNFTIPAILPVTFGHAVGSGLTTIR